MTHSQDEQMSDLVVGSGLIHCKACDHMVSLSARACPGCGHPLDSASTASRLGFARVLPLMFLVTAALSVGGFLIHLQLIGRLESLTAASDRQRPLAMLRFADAIDVRENLMAVGMVAVYAFMALMVIWSYRAYRAAVNLQPWGLKWSPGWAIGGWFIPFANFVVPKRVLNEIDRVTQTDNGTPPVLERWRGRDVLATGRIWWLLGIGGAILLVAGNEAIWSPTSTEAAIRTGLWLMAIGFLLGAVAQVFGAVYVRTLGARLEADR